MAAFNGRFDDHHGGLVRMLLDSIDALTGQIDKLTARIDESIVARQPPPAVGEPGANADGRHQPTVCDDLPVLQRLAEIPGLSERTAQVIVAELGLDMPRFPTADHLASWAKLTPRTIQSGAQLRNGKTGKGNPYLKGVLGESAAAATGPLGCRVDTGLLEDLPDCGDGDLHAQHEQVTVDPAVSPGRLLLRQAQKNPTHRPDRGRPPGPAGPGTPGMPASDQVPVPAQDGLRAHQQPHVTQHVARQPVQQGSQPRPVRPREPHPLPTQLPFENHDLVPQYEDLGVLATVTHRQ